MQTFELCHVKRKTVFFLHFCEYLLGNLIYCFLSGPF